MIGRRWEIKDGPGMIYCEFGSVAWYMSCRENTVV